MNLLRDHSSLWIVFCTLAFGFLGGRTTVTKAEPGEIGEFTHASDVGQPNLTGSAKYDAAIQSYRLVGAGSNMWFGNDQHFFLHRAIQGDFIATCQVRFEGTGVDPHRKIGWIARESLDPACQQVGAVIHGDGLTSMQYREKPGADTQQIELPSGADVVRLERHGNVFTISAAKFGEELQSVSQEIDLPNELQVGLFVCSHNAEVLESAIFSNVRVTIPVHDNYQPYRDYIGSNLEVMDIETGQRKIVHQADDSFQAPNWTRDGKALIYNHNGRLVRFDLNSQTPEWIDTGIANRNNNDHVISFDGKTLGISHHAEEADGQSVVYTLPIGGGEPERVTTLSPSYLHGFSPDGKQLIYTAGRDNVFNIFRIGVTGGEETKLTDEPTLDDGAEFSPDGKYIYFNSSRSGSMEIWRMKANGKNPEQLTNAPGNRNWFPHVSPNGKQLVYIAFPNTIGLEEHPFYQRVTLKMIPVEGGKSKTIAYLYGGQGTINVHSWSPDGKRIAFVSNTKQKVATAE